MTALTQDRDTLERKGELVTHPVAATTKIYAGGIACLNAAGDVVPGSTALNLKAVGRAERQVDNLLGAAGDWDADILKGTFKYANEATDLIDRTHIGGTAYIVDDQTVAATDGAGTRSAAGEIVQVDADGVWVKFS